MPKNSGLEVNNNVGPLVEGIHHRRERNLLLQHLCPALWHIVPGSTGLSSWLIMPLIRARRPHVMIYTAISQAVTAGSIVSSGEVQDVL
jgi:hypothetical protein